MRLRKILVAIDFAYPYPPLLEIAGDFASAFGARVRLLHVVEVTPGMEPPDEHPTALEAQFEEARGRLAILGERLGCETELRRGAAGEQIVAAAEEMGAELIVLGSRGRRGLAHAFLGSVAEFVMRRAPCPVLTARMPRPGERQGLAPARETPAASPPARQPASVKTGPRKEEGDPK
jgi:nucleotide-binding universal stress UspA family protein